MQNNISQLMLSWYDQHARILPWRIPPLDTQIPNPYFIWLSEVMLQQTTVATVGQYYHKFINIWPTIHDLADASQDEVMAAWAGLGYYSRARNLHKTAQIISRDYAGIFPNTPEELIKLPGVGPYSAASISAIAFDASAAVMDGNIERIISRLYCIKTPLPAAKKELYALVAQHTPKNRAGDYAQSMMDLGATICTPKKPLCSQCPIKAHCKAYKSDLPENYPYKLPKVKKPSHHGHIFLITNSKNQIIIQKRPNSGLFGGMEIFPYYNPHEHKDKVFNMPHMLLPLSEFTKIGTIKHVFTHFTYHGEIIHIRQDHFRLTDQMRWLEIDQLDMIALPTLMQKALKFYKNNHQLQLI